MYKHMFHTLRYVYRQKHLQKKKKKRKKRMKSAGADMGSYARPCCDLWYDKFRNFKGMYLTGLGPNDYTAHEASR